MSQHVPNSLRSSVWRSSHKNVDVEHHREMTDKDERMKNKLVHLTFFVRFSKQENFAYKIRPVIYLKLIERVYSIKTEGVSDRQVYTPCNRR